jgi:uncharacterized repeat protein (TIGR03803 family)
MPSRRSILSTRTSCNVFHTVILAVILALVANIPAHAQTFIVLHSFTGGGDGAEPVGGVTIDYAGNLYGATYYGGQNNGGDGDGVVFKLSLRNSAWIFSSLYLFQGSTDGSSPSSKPVIGPDGSIYGTTSGGGASGEGTVFNLKPPLTVCKSVQCSWTLTTLHSFPGGHLDGVFPGGDRVVFDTAGNLYGTTGGGGLSTCAESGCGVVYELSPSQGQWTETRLYNFTADPNGYAPNGVTLDSSGNLFGTTMWGGTVNSSCTSGCGIVFELTPTSGGWTESIINSFQGGSQGWSPVTGVTLQAENLFGTVPNGGPYSGGLSYQIYCCNWGYLAGYAFNPSIGNGSEPDAKLAFDAAGNIYGTAGSGGAYGYGAVFELTPSIDGTYNYISLHDFTGGQDGAGPRSEIVFDTDGNLYGTAQAGGLQSCSQGQGNGCGVVWKITP